MQVAHALTGARPSVLPIPMPLSGPLSRHYAEDTDQVVLRHLKTPREIEAVLPLRDGIDLSAHAAAGAAFLSLEKKETNWDSSALSSVQVA